MAMATTAPWTSRVVSSAWTCGDRPSPISQRLKAIPGTGVSHAPPVRGLQCRWSSSLAAMRSPNGSNSYGISRGATVVAKAVIGQEEEQAAGVDVKVFLEDLKSVGRVRLIVNTGVAVLESVTSLDKLFYHTLPGRGEYANLMLKDENVDFHLLIDQVVSAKLETGKSLRGDIPTYMIRFIDTAESVAASLLVMWKPGTNGDYDDGQVDGYQNLLKKYGSEITFTPNESQ